ncbi:dimethylarginine dimethylaminohydrolase family protein [Burkholderia ubonensis]|uniref:Amidinotransferase n=1 Tax=Burkholderia ubonensis TaxID=101571 RepID=A0A119M320_9BURK|nr:amidinotransferase [Burkholderia ubonensis]AOK61489.1 amidinotransferase [Burkholderia ubonensis]KWD71421.1 amidinotransferase [Burkholderia ubonensis]KWD86724.1 amidinotransferase [Burkholderia ubonensis]KWD98191.1 amidinotransferase [Burkholderia ubonensis]KWE01209.1 amidinotransferase [Burkholderia ubonensis]
MHFTQAIVRRPAASCAAGLTTAQLGAPDYDRTLTQFHAYCDTLRKLGVALVELPPLDAFPDAHFVEDVAVVTPEFAVVTRPGAPARRGETAHIEAPLAAHRDLLPMRDGRLDGGDVMLVGQRFYIGLTGRTDADGIAAFESLVARYGYTVVAVPVGEGLHLKSVVNCVGDDTLLVNEALAGHAAFAGFRRIVVAPADEYAGNTLRVNDALITPAGYPRVHASLEPLGLPLHVIDTSEFRKMDGGLTCLSLRF